MGKIREPWASGFGYGGLAKKIYTRRLEMALRLPTVDGAHGPMVLARLRAEERALNVRAEGLRILIKTLVEDKALIHDEQFRAIEKALDG